MEQPYLHYMYFNNGCFLVTQIGYINNNDVYNNSIFSVLKIMKRIPAITGEKKEKADYKNNATREKHNVRYNGIYKISLQKKCC